MPIFQPVGSDPTTGQMPSQVEQWIRDLVAQVGADDGIPGPAGSVWRSGVGAPAGTLGVTGDWYLATNGAFYEKTSVSTYTLRGNLTGAAGTAGSVWRSGAGAPADALGAVGDFYINSTNGDYYEKTGASVYTLRGNLTGPAGTSSSGGTANALANWQPSTAYTAGTFVLSPDGQVVKAVANFTSGATYVAANWLPALGNGTAILGVDAAAINNSTTYVTSALSVQVEPNAIYRFDADLYYDASATADMKIGLVGPAGAAATWAPWGISNSASLSPSSTNFGTAGLGGQFSVGGVNVGTVITARPCGIIRTASAGGAFAIRYAQNSAEASDLTLRANSNLRLTRIG